MSILVCAFLIGIIAGLRALTAPTLVSWAAGLGWIHLEGTPFHFLSLNDKLPNTPSRKIPPQFITRIVMGGFSGAALGASHESLVLGLLAGAVGAVVGTLGGAEFRSRLVKAIGGNDLPIALLEDVIAVVGAYLIVSHT